MNILQQLKERFLPALSQLTDDPEPLLEMIRPTSDAKHGDYQANFAMPLQKTLGKPPRDIAAEIVGGVDLSELCQPPEVAGPGFINLRLQDEFVARQLNQMVTDERLGVPAAAEPKTYVIDFSAPNVAKPMHVGHIRSTVIGDALCRTLRYRGHRAISDNHLGDWGTQFGMIIYGWKHFADQQAYEQNPVEELGRLYRVVRQLMDYFESCRQLPKLRDKVAAMELDLAERQAEAPSGDKSADKKAAKQLRKLDRDLRDLCKHVDELAHKIEQANADAKFSQLIQQHENVGQAVLEETAKLHAGDAGNRQLWEQFLPACRQAIQAIYDRLGVSFDHELGESFYHDRLAGVVAGLEDRGLARESEGATCVFIDGFETPMIIRKQDGAYLYATTDLATIQYRMQQWQPDAILYVVDHRQSEHFQKLFSAARRWGFRDVDLRHIRFGTVMGEDGKPFRTRAGDTVGLEGLLNDAVAKAQEVVCQLDDEKKDGPQLSDDERRQVAWIIGHSAIKYADLSQNRESDYIFSFDKMVALNGNTATYMQYAYARVNSIFSRGNIDIQAVRDSGTQITVSHAAERALGLALLRFPEAIDDVLCDFRPNLLTDYLYNLAKAYSTFFESCPVLKAETDELRNSRLLLCDLTARTLRRGLELLGIEIVPRM